MNRVGGASLELVSGQASDPGSALPWEGRLGGLSGLQAPSYLWGQALACWGQLSESWLAGVEKGLESPLLGFLQLLPASLPPPS